MNRKLWIALFMTLALPAVALVAADPPDKPKEVKKFKTGAKPTPQHKITAAIAAGTLRVHRAVTDTPAQFAIVPPKLSNWKNDSEGDCVSAEEAFQVAAYSFAATGTEWFPEDATVQAFCSKYSTCDGAELLPVIQQMESDGFHQGQDVVKDGASSVVDYSNETILQNAISQGPVKIGIDSSGLGSGAGNQQGWTAFGGTPGQFTNEDHCVALCGYGPTDWLAKQLGVPTPAGAPANAYLLYTWSTIGIVDHKRIMAMTGEAYLRGPLAINGKALPPLGPTPGPPTPPIPPPGPGGNLYTMTTDPATGEIKFTPAPAGSVSLTPDEVKIIQAILAGQGKPVPPAPPPEKKPDPPKKDGVPEKPIETPKDLPKKDGCIAPAAEKAVAAVKACLCSPACTCGCNVGGPCSCGAATSPYLVRQAAPVFYSTSGFRPSAAFCIGGR